MPTLTLTFTNAQGTRLANAICIEQHGYKIGEDKTAFVKSFIIKNLKEHVKNYEGQVAQQAAINATFADIETNLNIS